MKSFRFVAPVLLLSLSTFAFTQEHAGMQKPATPKSDGQVAFGILKTLAGDWQGPVALDPPAKDTKDEIKPVHISMRVTSRGHAIAHEMQEAGTPLDPTKYDHPLTMLYLDGDHLTLVHYCDAGNRPRMVARPSADGKKVEFDFVDMSGGNEYGHMYHAVFTTIDADHHIEEWTYMMPGDKPMHARFDLHRVKAQAAGQ